jgi:hypothetical protein
MNAHGDLYNSEGVREFDAFLESSHFYDLAQKYRHASVVTQLNVGKAYEDLKAELRKRVRFAIELDRKDRSQ